MPEGPALEADELRHGRSPGEVHNEDFLAPPPQRPSRLFYVSRPPPPPPPPPQPPQLSLEARYSVVFLLNFIVLGVLFADLGATLCKRWRSRAGKIARLLRHRFMRKLPNMLVASAESASHDPGRSFSASTLCRRSSNMPGCRCRCPGLPPWSGRSAARGVAWDCGCCSRTPGGSTLPASTASAHPSRWW